MFIRQSLKDIKMIEKIETIYCLNPALDNEDPDLIYMWDRYSSKSNNSLFNKGISFKEICNKYAKF